MKFRRRLKLPPQHCIERLEDRLLLTGSPISLAETEPNNSIPQADVNPVPLTADTPVNVSGQIDSSSDIDLFRITMNFGDALSAQLKALALDPASSLYGYLRLFDATGNELVNSGPFNGSDPTLQFSDTSAGTNVFYIGVGDLNNTAYDPLSGDNEANGSFTGNYSLDLMVGSLADDGDTIATASDISLTPHTPVQQSGIIDAGGDVDLYHVSLKAGDTLDASVDTSNLGGLGTAVRLFNQQGQAITGSSISPSHLNFVAPLAGDYYVGVSADDNTQYDVNTPGSGGGAETGDYFVNFLVTPQDSDDTTATAHVVPFIRGVSTQSALPFTPNIANPTDVDFYRLDHLVVGDTLQLNIDTASLGSSLVARLRVFGPNGEVGPDNGSALDASQTFTITTAGTYFVGVSGAENSTYDPATGGGGTPSSTLGDYQLSLEVDSVAAVTTEAEPNNSINAPNVIVAGSGSVTGTITAGDVDYYMFTVTQPGLFVANVNTPGSNLDSRLSIYGPDQKLRMSSDNSAPGSVDPALELHLTPGTYWLAVDASPLAASGATTGDYSLDTTFTLANSPFAPQPTGPDGSSGLFPYGIATGDFNGDGVPDLVTADNGSGQISMLLGVNASTDPSKPRGDFSYQPAKLFSVGLSPVAVISTEAESGANSDGTVKTVPLDFNGDGITDLAIVNSGDFTGAASVTILYGDGHGNFHHRLVDSSGNPILDGSGNPVDDVAVGSEASAIAVADFNGDGLPDFAVTNATDGTVSIFLQQADGSFVQAGSPIAVGHAPENSSDPPISAPRDIIAGDFDGDGHMDLATADTGTSSVTVLYGDGSGAFTTQTIDLPPGSAGQSMRPTSLVAAQLKGDNFFDFAVADANLDTGSDDITTIFGGAGRTFQANDPVVVKSLPATGGQSEFDASIAVADFNGDGKLDLALSDIADARIAVVLGKGDGTFNLPAQQFVVNPGSAPRGIVVGDFNNDGRIDFATADGVSTIVTAAGNVATVSVFGGSGDGTFLSAPQLQTEATPSSLAVADFNDDGRADIITANANDASLLLNSGDATFQSSTTVNAGPSNIVATGDFNGDGRMDVITTDYLDPTTGAAPGQLSLLLGKGDGTFSDPIPIAAFPGVFSVVTGDFNHDGKLDFAVTISQFDPSNLLSTDNSVVVFLGDGTGGFTSEEPIAVGSLPRGLAVGDFNGDGNLDLAASNYGDGTVTVLYGDGIGGFGNAQTVAVGDQPGQLTVADFDKDGFQDIAVKSSGDDQVTILYGRADGNLNAADARQLHLTVADGTTDPVAFPEGIVAGDFNGDGLPDLATSNLRTGDVSVFLNQGGGQFAAEQRFAISDSKNLAADNFSIVTGDFNGDGVLDLATSNAETNNVSILLGDGSGKFKLADQSGGFATAPAPLLVDFNSDGVPDSVTMDAAGRVLLRLGRPGEPGVFAPPIVVNADSIAAGIPAADFALINDGQQHLLGILGRSGTGGSHNSTVTLYKFNKSGLPAIVGTPTSLGEHYDRITAAKLNSDNRDDLVAISSTSGMLAKFVRSGQGFQAAGAPIAAANAPSSLVAANLGVSGVDSLIIADQATGALNVIGGGATGSIANYRGSVDADGFDPSSTTASMPISFDGSSIAIVGNFNDLDDQLPDLAVIHGGTNSLDLLLETLNGGFADPQADQEIVTGSHPIAVVAADFNGDHHLDLAVLNGGDNSISIFLGDGHGNFHRQLTAGGLPVSFSAGSLATSLSVADVNRDGKLDLLVGNQYGDVTILLGQGNGSFQPSTGIDRGMAIAVGDFDGDGQPDWVVSNRSGDQLVVQHAQPGTGFTQSGGNGLMAPAGVAVADLDGDGIPDVVVADSGGNDVIVYLSSQQFVGQSFFAGTDPVDVQIADVDGAVSPIDGQKHLDLIVTNYGSNDVSILLGTGDTSDGGKNLFTPGARLNAGQGPVSTQVVTHADGTPPDLLVTNSVSNNVYMLQPAGGGFYHDNTPTIFNTGRDPTQTLVGNFDGTMGFVTLNRDSNSLTFYSGFDSANRRDLSSGGTTPITAVAADFNNDGMTDLVVGNNGNGVFSIFTGEQAGLSLTGGFIDNSLSHPAALAIGQFGQGKELQLLAVDEGDESVHVFGRENLVGDPNSNFNAQLLAATTTSLGAILGLNSSGLNLAVTITSALGLSLQGVLSQTSDTVAAEGGGTDVNRSLPLEIFDDLGTAVSGGQKLLESALASVGGALGLKFDEHHVAQTIEDVVAILFPHLPLHVLPSVIHNLLGSAPKKTSPGPVAIDQAMENYDAESWTDDLLQAIDESPDAVVPAPSSGDEQGLVFSVERIGDVASIHFEPSRVAAIANQKQKQMANMLEVRRMSALAAVMGAIGMGGWLYRSRRQRDEFDVSDGD